MSNRRGFILWQSRYHPGAFVSVSIIRKKRRREACPEELKGNYQDLWVALGSEFKIDRSYLFACRVRLSRRLLG
jgi:hypothetical protein